MTLQDLPHGKIGDNQPPDWAKDVTDRMAMDYAAFVNRTSELLDQARGLPKDVTDETLPAYSKVVVDLRDHAVKMKALHTAEKEPYLRGGEAVDQFFFGQIDKVARRNRTNNPGAADILQSRVDDFVRRKAEAERQARLAEQRKAEEAERKARLEREENERKAKEAELAAARSRKAENKEAHLEAAEQAKQAAGAAQAEEDVARGNAQDARAAALAPTADLVRTRTDEGTLVTAKREPYVEITDEMKLDPATLWAFVKTEHKLQALKAWAKVTGHKQPMKGAIIEMRDRAVIR